MDHLGALKRSRLGGPCAFGCEETKTRHADGRPRWRTLSSPYQGYDTGSTVCGLHYQEARRAHKAPATVSVSDEATVHVSEEDIVQCGYPSVTASSSSAVRQVAVSPLPSDHQLSPVPSVPKLSPAASVFDIGQQLRWSMEEHGFVVLGGHIRKEHCRKACAVIDSHIANTLLSMGYPEESKHVPRGVLQVPHKAWFKSPPEWDGEPFGIRHRLGHNRVLGGGVMFSSKSFRAKEDLVHVQNGVRGVNEQLYQACCERVEEGAGFKLSGQVDPWKTHLDINRLGTYQNLIGLTDTVVEIYPKSHTMPWPTSGGFYELTTADMENLARKGIALTQFHLNAGDVLIMEGGRLVHTVPGVPTSAGDRYMTYAHFRPESEST